MFRPNSGTVRKLDNILYRFGFSAKTKYIFAREDFSKTTYRAHYMKKHDI
jgi:hypothetical protein